MNNQTDTQDTYPPLPEPDRGDALHGRCYSAEKLRAYVDADRTLRAGQSEEGRMPNSKRDYIEGMSVSVDVSTSDDDAENRYFGTVTEVMDAPDDKHGVTLLVQNAKPNFTRPGTLPKDHLVFALIGEFSDACQLPKPYAAVEARIKLEQEIRRLAGRAGQSEPVAWMHESGNACIAGKDNPNVSGYTIPLGRLGGAGQSPTVPTAELLFEIANELHGEFDKQTYDEKRRAEWDLQDGDEFSVSITFKQERALSQAIYQFEKARAVLRSTLPQTTGGKGS